MKIWTKKTRQKMQLLIKNTIQKNKKLTVEDKIAVKNVKQETKTENEDLVKKNKIKHENLKVEDNAYDENFKFRKKETASEDFGVKDRTEDEKLEWKC